MTSIAIRGKDCVVCCVQHKVPDKLIVPQSVTSIYNIIDSVGVVIVGNPNDGKSLVTWLRHQAAEHKMKMGYEIPVRVLAEKLAGVQQ